MAITVDIRPTTEQSYQFSYNAVQYHWLPGHASKPTTDDAVTGFTHPSTTMLTPSQFKKYLDAQ
mgnify:CR=1 FL=1